MDPPLKRRRVGGVKLRERRWTPKLKTVHEEDPLGDLLFRPRRVKRSISAPPNDPQRRYFQLTVDKFRRCYSEWW